MTTDLFGKFDIGQWLKRWPQQAVPLEIPMRKATTTMVGAAGSPTNKNSRVILKTTTTDTKRNENGNPTEDCMDSEEGIKERDKGENKFVRSQTAKQRKRTNTRTAAATRKSFIGNTDAILSKSPPETSTKSSKLFQILVIKAF